MSSPNATGDRPQLSVGGEHDVTRKRTFGALLGAALRRQKALSEFSLYALRESDSEKLVERTVTLTAKALKVDFCTVLALEPDGKALRVAAGHSWPAHRLGRHMSAAECVQCSLALERYSRSDAESPDAPRPVVIEDLRHDEPSRDTFRVRELGVVSSVCVVIPAADRPYGTLVAHSRVLRRFKPAECEFVQAVANVLSAALARCREHDALLASEQRFRSLTKLSSDWYYEQDAELRFSFVSEGFFLKSGMSRADVLGKRRWELSAGSPLNTTWDAHRAVLEARLPFSEFEFERVEADGTKHYQATSGEPMFDAEGRFTGYRGTGRDVTERFMTHAALQESEDRYRDLVEHNQDLICTHQLDGRIRSVNPWAAKVLGYEVAELLNMSIRDVLAPERRSEFDAFIGQLRKDGVASGLMLVQCRSGEKRLWKYTNSLRTEGVPAPIVRGMAHDVTEQTRAERALAESEQRYRTLFESSPEPMYLFDHDSLVILAANQRMVEQYGWSREELVRMSKLELRPPEARADLGTEVRDATGTRVKIRRRHWRRSGEVFDVEITAHDVEWGGRPARMVIAVDITERQHMESALREQRRLLARAQELAGLGYWEYDAPTGLMKGSRELRRMLEIPIDLPGQTPEWSLDLVHPQDRERVSAAVRRAIEEGTSFKLEARITTVERRERIMVLSGEGVKDAAGHVSKVIGSCIDITDQRRRENALCDAADQLQSLSRRLVEAEETERHRLAGELHDRVGQNLSALGINLDILAGRMSAVDADTKRRLRDSLALLDETALCVEGVLDDLRPPMLQEWGIGPTVQWVAEDFSRRTEIPARVRVQGMERRIDRQNELVLVRIVQEALTNVAKHAQAGNVEVSLGWETDSVRLEVADDGVGFERNGSGSHRGLGLVSMRERVQAANGLLDIESAPGKGTRVRALVPG